MVDMTHRDHGPPGQAAQHRRRQGRHRPTSPGRCCTRAACGAEFCQLSGEDANALAFLAHGGHGCISVTANVAPRLCADMHDAWRAGRPDEALAIHDRLIPLHKALFCETSPAPAKYALSRLGRCAAEVRLPLVEIAERSRERGRRGAGRRGARSERIMAEREQTRKLVAQNRRARHDYFIDERFEAGLVLTGTEVKSLREGRATISEAYAGEMGGEICLFNAYIPEFHGGNRFNHEPRRPRKLLLRKREIDRLIGRRPARGHDAGPARSSTSTTWGWAKLELGLAKGKKATTSARSIKERDWQREKQRIMRHAGR